MDELNRYLAADLAQSEALLDSAQTWNRNEVAMSITDPQDPRLKPGFAGIPSLVDVLPAPSKRPNSQWYTEAAVEKIRRDYETRIESLKRLLALRTDAMHRVIEKNEMLRAQQKVN